MERNLKLLLLLLSIAVFGCYFRAAKNFLFFSRNYFVVSKIIIIFAPTKMKHLFPSFIQERWMLQES